MTRTADLVDAAAVTGTAPNPSRFIPIPSRSISCALPFGAAVGDTTGADFTAAAAAGSAFAFASAA